MFRAYIQVWWSMSKIYKHCVTDTPRRLHRKNLSVPRDNDEGDNHAFAWIFSSRMPRGAHPGFAQKERDAPLIGRLTSAYNIVWMAHRPVITLQNLRRHKLRPVCWRPGEQRRTPTLTAVFTLQINSNSYRESLSSRSLSRLSLPLSSPRGCEWASTGHFCAPPSRTIVHSREPSIWIIRSAANINLESNKQRYWQRPLQFRLSLRVNKCDVYTITSGNDHADKVFAFLISRDVPLILLA